MDQLTSEQPEIEVSWPQQCQDPECMKFISLWVEDRIAQERERCAKICEDYGLTRDIDAAMACDWIAARIRSGK